MDKNDVDDDIEYKDEEAVKDTLFKDRTDMRLKNIEEGLLFSKRQSNS